DELHCLLRVGADFLIYCVGEIDYQLFLLLQVSLGESSLFGGQVFPLIVMVVSAVGVLHGEIVLSPHMCRMATGRASRHRALSQSVEHIRGLAANRRHSSRCLRI